MSKNSAQSNSSYRSLYSSKYDKIPNINGNGKNNELIGTSSSERINGGGWNDYIYSGGGSDFINGNGGYDILELTDTPLDYMFYQDSYNSWHIEKYSTGDIIAFKNIEQINFGDYTISINGEDNVPYAEDVSLSTLEDTDTQAFDLQSIVWDLERDLTGDPLTFKIEIDTVSPHGSYTITEEGMLVFTPTDSYAGQDSFTYTVKDGTHEVTRTVSIDVEAVADIPDLVVDVLAGEQVNHVVFDISTMLNDLDGSEELQLFFNGIPDGVALYDSNGNPIGPNGIYLGNGATEHDLQLTMVLPKNYNWDFPLEIVARSTELQNAENSVTIAVPTATASTVIDIDYGVEITEISSEFLANDQSIWNNPNSYVSHTQFLGLDADTSGGLFGTVDYNIDVKTGIEAEAGVKGGTANSGMSFDMDFINYHNYTTNMLEIDTSFVETDSWFETEDVVTFIDFDAIMDIYASIGINVSLDVIIDTINVINQTFSINQDYEFDILSFQSDQATPYNLAFSYGNLSVSENSIEYTFKGDMVSIEVFRDHAGTAGDNNTDGSISLDIADITLDVDEVIAYLAGYPGMFGGSYSVSPFGGVSYDFIDFDIIGGMDVQQSFDQDFSSLFGELLIDGSSTNYIVGDTLVFNDVADDAVISTILDVEGLFNNDTDIIFALDYALKALAVELDLNASADIPGTPAVKDPVTGSTIIPAIPGYTFTVDYNRDAAVWETDGTITSTSYGVYDNSTTLDFEDQSYILFV
ncbi:Ig-like domain-containing protein [Pseudemcibacter aquimaris]|uniref:Ig-like domain-containing protein n=1 Tax=Pseudemcibacter aquimaris TaxID=2857064 RepID=UPI002011A62A|nr:Ig-like domain-containing protein [Pseudemcibacter aquimaris]MCC3861077.1 Ig-like domain-containing protein [Pseudemcibacter aquimaris]WDU59895.1 cadherin-like domain-containing protein [Pseudemcibacter aquimaris]